MGDFGIMLKRIVVPFRKAFSFRYFNINNAPSCLKVAFAVIFLRQELWER